MKINYCSDLHLNYISNEELPKLYEALKSPADVLIIAGDLFAKKSKRVNAAQELINSNKECDDVDHAKQIVENHNHLISDLKQALSDFSNPVIYVPGNHEFHGMTLLDDYKEYKNLFSSNVYYLNNECVTINSQKFVGSTMWYEPTTFQGSSDFHVKDFRKDFDKVSLDSRNFLEKEVTTNSIVVTHMLPSPLCVHLMWAEAESNLVFVRDMTNLIMEKSPHAWIYGHSHDPVADFKINNTKLLCNSRGNEDQNISWQMKSFKV